MSLVDPPALSSSVNKEQSDVASSFHQVALTPPLFAFFLSVICYSALYRIHYAKSYIRILSSHVKSFLLTRHTSAGQASPVSVLHRSRRLFGSYSLLLSVLWPPFEALFLLILRSQWRHQISPALAKPYSLVILVLYFGPFAPKRYPVRIGLSSLPHSATLFQRIWPLCEHKTLCSLSLWTFSFTFGQH